MGINENTLKVSRPLHMYRTGEGIFEHAHCAPHHCNLRFSHCSLTLRLGAHTPFCHHGKRSNVLLPTAPQWLASLWRVCGGWRYIWDDQHGKPPLHQYKPDLLDCCWPRRLGNEQVGANYEKVKLLNDRLAGWVPIRKHSLANMVLFLLNSLYRSHCSENRWARLPCKSEL